MVYQQHLFIHSMLAMAFKENPTPRNYAAEAGCERSAGFRYEIRPQNRSFYFPVFLALFLIICYNLGIRSAAAEIHFRRKTKC